MSVKFLFHLELKKAKLLSVKSSTKDTLNWKAIPGVKGYQIYRATSKNGDYKLVKTIESAKKTTCTIGNTKKKKYYYRIATIDTYREVVYRSDYSNVLSNR